MIHSEQQGWVRGVPKTIHIEILTSKIVNRSIMVMSIRMNHQPRVSPLGYAISAYWVKLTLGVERLVWGSGCGTRMLLRQLKCHK